jgi:hypothetical protein
MAKNTHPGRPPKYKTAKELQDKIDDYFNKPTRFREVWHDGERVKIPIFTITGLVLHLGFCDRASFYDYENRNEDFSHSIKAARTFIEREYEELLHSGNCTGSIFALKNFGWKDKSELEQTTTVTMMGTVEIDGKPFQVAL